MTATTATTAREIVFSHDGLTRRVAAGTTVYVTTTTSLTRRGQLRLRVPGTLFTQDVYPSSVR